MVSKKSLVIYSEKWYTIGSFTSNSMSYMICGFGRYWRLRKSKALMLLVPKVALDCERESWGIIKLLQWFYG
jgi:hypothetical protein